MVDKISGSSGRYSGSSEDRNIKVKFGSGGTSLIAVDGDEIFVRRYPKGLYRNNQPLDEYWYLPEDKDHQHPYRLTGQSRGDIRTLAPIYPDTKRSIVPYMLRKTLEDPLYADKLKNMNPSSSMVINNYEFVTIVTQENGKNVRKMFYAKIGDYDASTNSLRFHSVDNTDDTSIYKLIRDDNNRAKILGLEKVTDAGSTKGSQGDTFTAAREEAPKKIMNVGTRGKATSRYEQNLEDMLSSTDYPRRGNLTSVGGKRYFIAEGGRKFVQEDGLYYEVNSRGEKIDKSISYKHFQHGDRRIMNYLLPGDAVPFPRSMPQDFASLYANGNQKPSDPKRTIKIAPTHGEIVIPEELRAPGEDGRVAFNIGEKGITQFDDENHGPGDPSYLHWNHETAPDMLADAGIKITPKFYSQGKKLRYLEIEFTKNGVFIVNNKKYTVTDDGITVEDIKTTQPQATSKQQKQLPVLDDAKIDVLIEKGILSNVLALYSDKQLVEIMSKVSNKHKLDILGNIPKDKVGKIIKALPADVLIDFDNYLNNLKKSSGLST